jgi:hypothetical protein
MSFHTVSIKNQPTTRKANDHGKIFVGLNAEFSRSSDKPFEWAVKAAADMGRI